MFWLFESGRNAELIDLVDGIVSLDNDFVEVKLYPLDAIERIRLFDSSPNFVLKPSGVDAGYGSGVFLVAANGWGARVVAIGDAVLLFDVCSDHAIAAIVKNEIAKGRLKGRIGF